MDFPGEPNPKEMGCRVSITRSFAQQMAKQLKAERMNAETLNSRRRFPPTVSDNLSAVRWFAEFGISILKIESSNVQSSYWKSNRPITLYCFSTIFPNHGVSAHQISESNSPHVLGMIFVEVVAGGGLPPLE